MLKLMEEIGHDLRVMAKDDPDLFLCFWAWMFFFCEVIHSLIEML